MKQGFFQITTKLFLMDGNHLLILQDRQSGTADLPGGRITQDEFHAAWSQALRRELLEELGPQVQLTVQPQPLFAFPHFVLSDATDALGLAFRGSYLGGTIVLSDEHDRWEWVRLATLEPHGVFPPTLARAVERFALL